MKPVDVKSGTFINFDAKCDGKFKVGDYVRISKYKNKLKTVPTNFKKVDVVNKGVLKK